MPYTAADARREFKPRLRRYNVRTSGSLDSLDRWRRAGSRW